MKKLKLYQIVLLLLNIIILVFNIFFALNYFIKLKSTNIIFFKYSDGFDLNLLKNTYQKISKYLNNKYNTFIKMKTSRKIATKKVLKIKSTGLFNIKFHRNWLLDKLDDEFIISFNETNPDYLIYNVFGNEDNNSEYQQCIKIAIYTENVMPDINKADYIIGHYHINYLDRYFKYSIFLWKNFSEINNKRKEVLNKEIRYKFCAAVISNCGAKFRMNFIKKLNEYKKVDMGGKCDNNIKRVVKDKIEFLSEYKFSIAMENSNGDGYLSEKIVDSFLSGTIPIYYGDYIVDEFINPKTYILIKGENDIEKKIEYIKLIDKNDNLYKNIMKEKPIIDDNFINKIDRKEIKSFLKNIFNQNKSKAYRRDNY